MKRAVIVHGWDGSPDEPMLQWLKSKLVDKAFTVSVPAMPNPERPTINSWVATLAKVIGQPDRHLYLVGHSIGCQAVLRYVAQTARRIGGIVLIAPWMTLDKETIREEGEEVVAIAKPWMETPLDWNSVRQCTDKVTCIFSDNDPYVPVDNRALFEKNLGATIIIEHGKGHFSPADGVNELPSAINSIIKMATKDK